MLGLLGMLSGMLAVTAVISYWISWDMQPQDGRPSFTGTVYSDLVKLFAKWRSSSGRAGSRSTATADQVSNSVTRQVQLHVP
jgi:hypothetical protein